MLITTSGSILTFTGIHLQVNFKTLANSTGHKAGASGVVMYNHIPLESSRVITPDAIHGAAMLSYADGARVLAALAAGSVTMTFFNDSPVSFLQSRGSRRT